MRRKNSMLNSSVIGVPCWTLYQDYCNILYFSIFFNSFLAKYTCYPFCFTECCAVIIALPSLSQTLPTELKESRPSATC